MIPSRTPVKQLCLGVSWKVQGCKPSPAMRTNKNVDSLKRDCYNQISVVSSILTLEECPHCKMSRPPNYVSTIHPPISTGIFVLTYGCAISAVNGPYLAIVWTSGTRRRRRFRWRTGRIIGRPGSYVNWGNNGALGTPQPDNAFGNEYCLAALKPRGQRRSVWHDVACNNVAHFICERPYF